ncbi:hypothetical protein OH77DRAFT_1420529 [Trametes cingulata]|nr:hypothetical protein OH77DRAFT_1420529 [Trametes cingulata]
MSHTWPSCYVFLLAWILLFPQMTSGMGRPRGHLTATVFSMSLVSLVRIKLAKLLDV